MQISYGMSIDKKKGIDFKIEIFEPLSKPDSSRYIALKWL